jgi:hypothetical protein
MTVFLPAQRPGMALPNKILIHWKVLIFSFSEESFLVPKRCFTYINIIRRLTFYNLILQEEQNSLV